MFPYLILRPEKKENLFNISTSVQKEEGWVIKRVKLSAKELNFKKALPREIPWSLVQAICRVDLRKLLCLLVHLAQ